MSQQAKIDALESLVLALVEESFIRKGLPWEAVFNNAHKKLADLHSQTGSSDAALAANELSQLKAKVNI